MFFLSENTQKKICAKLARWLTHHDRFFLVAAIFLGVISLFFARGLSIESNYLAFLPESLPSVQKLREVIDKTGGFGNFMIVLEEANPELRRKAAEALAKKISLLPWVGEANAKKNWENIESSKLLYLSIEDLSEIKKRIEAAVRQEKGSSNPFFVSLLTDEEKLKAPLDFSDIEHRYQMTTFGSAYFEDPALKYTVVIVWPKGSMTDMDFARAAYKDLREAVSETLPEFVGVKGAIGGEFRNKIDEYDSLVQNVLGSSILTFGAIMMLLAVFYRRIAAVFYTLIPLVLGSILSMGLAAILVGKLNLLTVFLVAILFGIGIDYGIYLFSRYVEERKNYATLEETVACIMLDTGRAIIGAALTTALAFFILVFTDFRGFREFGLLAAVGIIVILFTYILYSPVLWSCAERWGLIQVKSLREPLPWVPLLPRKKSVVWGGVALAFIAGLGFFRLEFEYDYGKLRSLTNTYWALNKKIHAVFPLSKTPAIIITHSIEETEEVVSEIRRILPQTTTVDAVKSILDFMPGQETDDKKAILADIRNVLDANYALMKDSDKATVDAYRPYLNPPGVTPDDVPKSLLKQFIYEKNGEKGYLVNIYDKVRLSDARNAQAYARDIGKIQTERGTYYPAEGAIIFGEVLEKMKEEALMAFMVMLAVVFGALWWETGTLKDAAVVMTPLLLGLMLTMGGMALLGFKFNMFNLVVFPILMGVADDASIHMFYRVRGDQDDATMNKHIKITANSVLMATLATILGFASVLSADHQGLRSLGMTAVLGLVCQVSVLLWFFPAFLTWVYGKKT